jgi:hypothetical protein
LKYFVRLLENILWAGQRFLNGIHVSRLTMSVEDEHSGWAGTSRTTANVEINLRTHPWAHRHLWNQLWNLPRDRNRHFEHALYGYFITTCPPTRPWKPCDLCLTRAWLSCRILPTHQT